MLENMPRTAAPTRLSGVLEDVTRVVEGDFLALMLFGSAARGDAGPESDIDVLQLCSAYKPSYRKGHYGVSVYTPGHLQEIATKGSLFVLHLRLEGALLTDPEDALGASLSAYIPPKDYDSLKQDLCASVELLNVSPLFYADRWAGCNSLVLFLLRTILFAHAAERSEESNRACSGDPLRDAPSRLRVRIYAK